MFKVSGRIGAVAVITTTLLVASCGLPIDKSSQANNSGNADERLVLASRSVPETLDPAQSQFGSNETYISGIYDRLLRVSEDAQVVPSLAQEWSYSDDATKVTLHLRPGVRFHSGNPFTAKDVIYTLDRVSALAQATATLISDYKSATITNDLELVISLKKPNLDFTKALSAIFVLDSELVRANEGTDRGQQWLSNHDAGSGPYKLKVYNPNAQVEFERTEGHWMDLGRRPRDLVVRIIGEPSAIRDELRAGGADMAWAVPAADVASFASGKSFTVTEQSAKRVTLGFMNTQVGVTTDPRVREAMQLAFDSAGHVQSTLKGYGQVGSGVVPRGLACRVGIDPIEPNLQRATELIKDAGAQGKKVTLGYQPIFAEHSGAGTLLESALTQIGLKVEVQQVTYPQLVEMVKNPATAPTVSVLWDSAIYPAVSQMLTTTWHSGSPTNYGHYSNASVDELIDEGRSATDPAVACSSFEKAQKQIIDDRAAIYVAEPQLVIVTNSKVGPVKFSPASLSGIDLALLTLAV
ncbi:ABC transporter substrate-binding protein [Paenarthrobacter sp. NPDC057981]|uniref:ABC transporter substrate-binding protein n=1 Tax=Paenarthrobacter sp. NPDC057981 TaxID=3346297 RepID=UPI0036D9C0F3